MTVIFESLSPFWDFLITLRLYYCYIFNIWYDYFHNSFLKIWKKPWLFQLAAFILLFTYLLVARSTNYNERFIQQDPTQKQLFFWFIHYQIGWFLWTIFIWSNWLFFNWYNLSMRSDRDNKRMNTKKQHLIESVPFFGVKCCSFFVGLWKTNAYVGLI